MAGTTTNENWMTSGFVRALFRRANAIHNKIYRASGGKIGGTAKGVPIALLTTRGRKTGKMYTCPVGYVTDGDEFLLVGSAGGSPRNPDWYYNLRANREVTLQIGSRQFSMFAEPQTGPSYDSCLTTVLKQYPVFATYQRKVTRQIPIVLLRPSSNNGTPGSTNFGAS